MGQLSRSQAEAMNFQYHFRLEGEVDEPLAVIQEMSDYSDSADNQEK